MILDILGPQGNEINDEISSFSSPIIHNNESTLARKSIKNINSKNKNEFLDSI